MKKCLSCNKEVDDLAHNCPHCGGNTLMMTGDPKAAVEIMKKQQEAARHLDQGAVYFREQRYDEAEQEVRKALDLNPSNANAHGNMGYLLVARGRPAEAIACFEKALQLNPNHPTARDSLEQARRQAGAGQTATHRGPSEPGSQGKKSGCFVATACYGDFDAPHVVVLRDFRDAVLVNSPLGRSAVSFYYRYSPPLAKWIASRPLCRWVVRNVLLDPFVFVVKALRGR